MHSQPVSAIIRASVTADCIAICSRVVGPLQLLDYRRASRFKLGCLRTVHKHHQLKKLKETRTSRANTAATIYHISKERYKATLRTRR